MALSNERDTPEAGTIIQGYPVLAGAKIFKGSLVVLDGGYACPGKAATAVKCVGRAEETVDNAGLGNGGKVVLVKRGCFRFANSAAADAIAQADVGNTCYVVDDQTVAKTDGHAGETPASRSAAGVIEAVDAAGVWVSVGL
jgi:hypothetical protein